MVVLINYLMPCTLGNTSTSISDCVARGTHFWGSIEGFSSGGLVAQWVQLETPEPRLSIDLAIVGKGVQHSVLAIVSQHSGRRANGFPRCD